MKASFKKKVGADCGWMDFRNIFSAHEPCFYGKGSELPGPIEIYLARFVYCTY
jgi:hypothetical protein